MSQKPPTVDELSKLFGSYHQLVSEASSESEEEGRENYNFYSDSAKEDSDSQQTDDDDDRVVENDPTFVHMASQSDNSDQEQEMVTNDPTYVYSDPDNADNADDSRPRTSRGNARKKEEQLICN